MDEPADAKADLEIEFGSEEFFELVWKLYEDGRNDEAALEGDVFIEVDGKSILIKGPNPETK